MRVAPTVRRAEASGRHKNTGPLHGHSRPDTLPPGPIRNTPHFYDRRAGREVIDVPPEDFLASQVALDSAVQSIQRTAKVNVAPSGKLHQAKPAHLNFQGPLQPHYQCVTPLGGHVGSSRMPLVAAAFNTGHPTNSETGSKVEADGPSCRKSNCRQPFRVLMPFWQARSAPRRSERGLG